MRAFLVSSCESISVPPPVVLDKEKLLVKFRPVTGSLLAYRTETLKVRLVLGNALEMSGGVKVSVPLFTLTRVMLYPMERLSK